MQYKIQCKTFLYFANACYNLKNVCQLKYFILKLVKFQVTFHLRSGMSGFHLQDRKTLVFSNYQSNKFMNGTIGN